MKTYVKPELYFESFELSQHIAACDLKLGYNIDNCAIVEHEGGKGTSFADLEIQMIDSFVSYACRFQAEIYCYTNGANYMPRTFQS